MSSQPRKLPSANEEGTSVMAVLAVLRKHWPILVACSFLAAGISLIHAKTLPRVYEAAALLELDPNVTRPLGERTETAMPLGAGDYLDNQEYYETQYRIITSGSVMEAAARDVGLQNDFAFFGLKAPPPRPVTVQEAGAVLRSRVAAEPVKNSRLVYVKVDDGDPKRAKRLADAVAQAYIDQNLEKAISTTSDSVSWLNGQIDTVKKDLETNENALHAFKEKNDLPSTSINESSNMLRNELQELSTTLTRTRTRREELTARYSELSKINGENLEQLPSSELLASPYLQQLRKDYLEVLRTRDGLRGEGKGENHPQVKSTEQRLIETRTALMAEVKNIQGAVERDLAVVQKEEAGESALYEAARRRAVDLSMKEIEYHRLDRSRDQSEKLYAMLIEHMKDADLARMMKVNNIHLVEAATEPVAPIRPRVSLNVMVGAAIGLAIGLALAWLRHTLDSSLKTPEDVERTLGITFLGLLPAVGEPTKADKRLRRRGGAAPDPALERPELIVHERPHSGIAEAARSIRTNLLFTNPDKPYRKLLVTSSAPAEGKTTVACSIAVALAQSGQRVCIIDCDLRRPRLHRIFDRSGDAGVTNVLVGDATIADVAKPTHIENLWCIPSGPIPPNPADLLHSERFQRFLENAAEGFDRIVIDSPPVVAVTDSAIISTLVDGTVFVLRAFSTSRTLGRQGMRVLADVDSPVIGAVLNAVDLSRQEYTYYQYYYYKREGYPSAKPAAPDPDAASAPPTS